MPDRSFSNAHREADTQASSQKWQKWGGAAFFVFPLAFITASMIYLTGDLRATIGPYAYSLADFLYGPVWAASLVTAIFALRERLGKAAPRRTTLALLAAFAAAGAMVGVAFIRSANRQYHLLHPDLHLEDSTSVLAVWTALVAGVSAVGWHFLGWVYLLAGWAGSTTHQLPRLLNGLLIVAGAAALFVYQFPNLEGFSLLLGVIVSIWLGNLLLRTEPAALPEPDQD